MLAINNGIALLFALIGIFNGFSAVAGNLAMRRREFAMLRSVGLDRRGLHKILFLEGLFFALRPILLAVPWIAGICGLFLWMADVPLSTFGSAFPLGEILLYGAVILAAMGTAYLYGVKAMGREAIVETLRRDLV